MKTTKTRKPKATAAPVQLLSDFNAVGDRGIAVENVRKVCESLLGLSEVLRGRTEIESWGMGANLRILSDLLSEAHEDLVYLEDAWKAELAKTSGRPAAA